MCFPCRIGRGFHGVQQIVGAGWCMEGRHFREVHVCDCSVSRVCSRSVYVWRHVCAWHVRHTVILRDSCRQTLTIFCSSRGCMIVRVGVGHIVLGDAICRFCKQSTVSTHHPCSPRNYPADLPHQFFTNNLRSSSWPCISSKTIVQLNCISKSSKAETILYSRWTCWAITWNAYKKSSASPSVCLYLPAIPVHFILRIYTYKVLILIVSSTRDSNWCDVHMLSRQVSRYLIHHEQKKWIKLWKIEAKDSAWFPYRITEEYSDYPIDLESRWSITLFWLTWQCEICKRNSICSTKTCILLRASTNIYQQARIYELTAIVVNVAVVGGGIEVGSNALIVTAT